MNVFSTTTISALFFAIAMCVLLTTVRPAAAQANREGRPEPTHAEVAYGPHERNVLDFWQAKGDTPRPLVIYIHGGGFRAGSKNGLQANRIQPFLDSGISVAALNYRLIAQDVLPAAHHDCRRAIQFLRTKAGEWNLAADRFGTFGGSAGAQICMYLAFHDDMAKPDSHDELQRQSTRLTCIATNGGQTTMDFTWWRQHIPGYDDPHRPATEYFGDVANNPEEFARTIRELSALPLLTADDPPISMRYGMAPDDPVPTDPERARGWKIHHVNFGVALQNKARELGVTAHLNYPDAEGKTPSDVDFFRKYLLAE